MMNFLGRKPFNGTAGDIGAHCGNRSDGLLNHESVWSRRFAAIIDCSIWLVKVGKMKKSVS